MIENVKKFFSGGSTPKWLMFVCFIATVGINYGLSWHLSASDRLSNNLVSSVASFEGEATKFNVLFSSLAFGVIKTDGINENSRTKIIENLTSQFTQISMFSSHVSNEEKAVFDRYMTKVNDTMKTVRALKGFDDMGVAYKNVGDLLQEQESLLERMREIAGLRT